MIDKIFAEQERLAEAWESPGSMKTLLEEKGAVELAQIAGWVAELQARSHALSEALRNVRIARAEGTITDLDRAMAALKTVMEAGR